MTTRSVSSNRAISLWIVTALVLDVAGAQHVYARQTVAAAVLLMLAVLWLLPADGGAPLSRGRDMLRRVVSLLPVVGLIAAMVDVAAFIPKDSGWTPFRLTLLFGGGLLLLAVSQVEAIWTALTACVLGTIIRTIHMAEIAIIPANGDMLPLVQDAITNLLGGNAPYRMYQMPWDVPLTYLPVTWLSYLPAYLLGVDLRWTNVAAELVILGALIWLSARRSNSAGWRDDPTFVLWAWLYLQPSIIHWDMGNTAPITWGLLAITLALILGSHERRGAVALGVTAAATPFAAVFGPFIGLYWLRQHGLMQTIRLLILSGLVAGVIVLPFLLWSPQDFVTGIYRWFNNIGGWPRQKWIETDPHIWSIITGFSGEFWARGTERWLKPIQALIVLVVAALYWLRGARAETLSTHAAVAYLGFMLFNPVLWPYLYNPALVVSLVGLVALNASQAARDAAPVPSHESRTLSTAS